MIPKIFSLGFGVPTSLLLGLEKYILVFHNFSERLELN